MGASAVTLAGPTEDITGTGMGVTFGSIVGTAATSAACAAESGAEAAPSAAVSTEIASPVPATSGAGGAAAASSTAGSSMGTNSFTGATPRPGQPLRLALSPLGRARPREAIPPVLLTSQRPDRWLGRPRWTRPDQVPAPVLWVPPL